ncbi:MAG: winged helix-turn-helix domain-containing protein [Actinomycetota bacterium]
MSDDETEAQFPSGAKQIGVEGLKALGDDTRRDIIDLLSDRPATVTDLATALGKAKGTIAHHVKVLEEAELVEVVSTRRVRAVEERTYGRTAPTFILPPGETKALGESWMVADAIASARTAGEGEVGKTSVRFARLSPEAAREFDRRLAELVDEFGVAERGGDTVYGLLVSLFPTDRPHLPDETEDDS